MAEPKTRPTTASVTDFIAKVPDEIKRADCKVLVKMMQTATGCKPVMWGEAIVGFGSKLDWPVIAFAPRKQDLTIYIMPGFDKYQPLLKKLGKHKTAKVCLYVKKLADVDLAVLKKLIEAAI